MSNARPLKPGHADYERLRKTLPEPPTNWALKSESFEAFSNDMVGCGISARRAYDTGDGEVIFVVQLTPALLHPPFSDALRSAVHKDVGGRHVFKLTEDSFSLRIGRMIIIFGGSGSEADKLKMLDRIDAKAIEDAGRPR